jgi:signal transduction histidine kinase
MSPLEVLQFVGYSMGAALHLWMGALLWRRRRSLGGIERVLLALTLGFGLWHAGNLVVALHGLLGLDSNRWSTLLRLADTVAVISVTLSYSFLLHVHLHLWASANKRSLTRSESVRVWLSYIPAFFLFVTVPRLWVGTYALMFEKLQPFVLPFAFWAAYVLVLVSVTDFLIARKAPTQSERRSMGTIAVTLFCIGLLILAVYAFGLGQGTTFGLYLKTLANLGSLLPSALIAYYIYRYRYLELIIQESLIVASFAAVVLAVYLYGIRTIGTWLTLRYDLRAGAVEALLILALVLLAAPLRRWLETRFHQIFEREAALYRDVVAHIGAHAGQYKQLPQLLRFIEERTTESLNLRRVQIVSRNWNQRGGVAVVVDDKRVNESVDDNGNVVNQDSLKWVDQILDEMARQEWRPLRGAQVMRERGYDLALALRREEQIVGLMLIDAAADSLTTDVYGVLEVLAGQVAIAIEDCRLVEENVRLERRLAHGERLAALGQMAATVAHEIKNPLSAIKSIAQVMREDVQLAGEYGRDLSLIVGETDRLNQSVTQLLSFARTAPPKLAPCRTDELLHAIIELFSAEARGRGLTLEANILTRHELDGESVSALRDALSNLLINALQATPAGGRVCVEAIEDEKNLVISVSDSGKGIAPELLERIWNPFFTTKQRGTGLGLAIVRKRMEEVGGTARLSARNENKGARFELSVPMKSSDER